MPEVFPPKIWEIDFQQLPMRQSLTLHVAGGENRGWDDVSGRIVVNDTALPAQLAGDEGEELEVGGEPGDGGEGGGGEPAGGLVLVEVQGVAAERAPRLHGGLSPPRLPCSP